MSDSNNKTSDAVNGATKPDAASTDAVDSDGANGGDDAVQPNHDEVIERALKDAEDGQIDDALSPELFKSLATLRRRADTVSHCHDAVKKLIAANPEIKREWVYDGIESANKRLNDAAKQQAISSSGAIECPEPILRSLEAAKNDEVAKALSSELYETLLKLESCPETHGLATQAISEIAAASKAITKGDIRNGIELCKKQQAGDSDSVGDELLEGIEPWSESVNGSELAFEIKRLFNRHCVLPPFADVVLTLWAVSTYTINEHRIYPKLAVESPDKRCGKTTLMEVLNATCYRSLTMSNVTSAVVFRLIEHCQPTMLIDEADTFIDGKDELRGIINSGHTRSGAFVFRVEGDSSSREVTRFSTWAPMALARIGEFGATIQDRSVRVPLKRKLSHETVTRLPIDLQAEHVDTRRKLLRWAEGNASAIRTSEPQVPHLSNDRAEDNWLALMKVAEVLGGDWPDLAKSAAIALTGSEDNSDDLSTMLLRDINEILQQRGWVKVIPSTTLCEELNKLSDRPWPSMRNDKGVSGHWLAHHLKPFELTPAKRRDGNSLTRGYSVEKFQGVFSRYVSESGAQSGTLAQTAVDQPFSGFQGGTNDPDVPDSKTLRGGNDEDCSIVPLTEGLPERSAQKANENPPKSSHCDDVPPSTNSHTPPNDLDPDSDMAVL